MRIFFFQTPRHARSIPKIQCSSVMVMMLSLNSIGLIDCIQYIAHMARTQIFTSEGAALDLRSRVNSFQAIGEGSNFFARI